MFLKHQRRVTNCYECVCICFGKRLRGAREANGWVLRYGYYMCVVHFLVTSTRQPTQQTVNINEESIRIQKSVGLSISRFGWWKPPTTFGRKGLLFWFCHTSGSSSGSINEKIMPTSTGRARMGVKKTETKSESKPNNCVYSYQKHGKRNSARKLNCIKIYSAKRCRRRRRRCWDGGMRAQFCSCKMQNDDRRF